MDERDSYERLAAYAEQHKYDSGLSRQFHRNDSFIGNLLLPGGGRLSAERSSGSFRIEGGTRRFTPDWQ